MRPYCRTAEIIPNGMPTSIATVIDAPISRSVGPIRGPISSTTSAALDE